MDFIINQVVGEGGTESRSSGWLLHIASDRMLAIQISYEGSNFTHQVSVFVSDTLHSKLFYDVSACPKRRKSWLGSSCLPNDGTIPRKLFSTAGRARCWPKTTYHQIYDESLVRSLHEIKQDTDRTKPATSRDEASTSVKHGQVRHFLVPARPRRVGLCRRSERNQQIFVRGSLPLLWRHTLCLPCRTISCPPTTPSFTSLRNQGQAGHIHWSGWDMSAARLYRPAQPEYLGRRLSPSQHLDTFRRQA